MSTPTLDALDRALAGRSRWAERAGALESLVLAVAREIALGGDEAAGKAILRRLMAIPEAVIPEAVEVAAPRPLWAQCGCAPPDRWCVAHWPKEGERP